MTRWLYALIGIVGLIFFLNGCNNLPIEANMSEEVNDFSFTNQNNDTVKLDDFNGEWWIADFVFTNCTTVCLPMTSNMSLLQEKMTENDITVQLVSFSVDPDYDTPEVLKKYGQEYEADFSSWHFLTGYDFKTIKELSIKSFRAMLKEPEYGSDQVTHDVRFFLVNPQGEVVKSYDGVKASSMDEILQDLLTLKSNDLL